MANNEQGVPPGEQGGAWRLTEGNPSPQEERYETYRSDGTENLTYTNPYGSEVERVWFDGKMVYALDCGDIDLDFDENRAARQKVAQEYQIVYAVELDEQGKFAGGREPEYVEGQYNIYDSVPGMEKYSPLWQFNYVVVGRDYEPNTLRSEADCIESGYRIERSTVAEN